MPSDRNQLPSGTDLPHDRYARVYQALDSGLSQGGRNPAPGTQAAIHAALSDFQAEGTHGDAVARLEQIAVSIHFLQQALQQRRPAEYAAHRARLEQLKREWIETTPLQ